MAVHTKRSVELVEDEDGATLSVERSDEHDEKPEPWFAVDKVTGAMPVNVSAYDLEQFARQLLVLVEHYRNAESEQ